MKKKYVKHICNGIVFLPVPQIILANNNLPTTTNDAKKITRAMIKMKVNE